MNAGVTGISQKELKRLAKQINDFNLKKTKQMQQLTELAGINITSKAKSKAPRYQSRLVNSIHPEVGRKKLSTRVVTDVEYAAFVEFGTKSKAKIPPELSSTAEKFKQTNSINFDEFYKDIKKWCKKKGIDEKAAYPIAISIIKNGQNAQPFLYPAFKDEVKKYMNAIKQLIAK